MELNDPSDLLVKAVQILDQLQIPYAVTGGFAVLVWGRPRFTADIDMRGL
jgi:Na+/glutamate symporter